MAASFFAGSQAYAENPPATIDAEGVPKYALWAGTRLGVFIPYGALYTDRSFVTTPFQDVATAGPVVEFDLGARLARHFVGYLYFDQAFLGRGSGEAWTTPHGGQSPPSTRALGAGMRWELNPSGFGVVADVGFAYRWFTARWADATVVRMHGPGDVRLGIGASWRATKHVTLAPMATAFSGVFSNRYLDGQELGESASAYAAIALTLSGHLDLY